MVMFDPLPIISLVMISVTMVCAQASSQPKVPPLLGFPPFQKSTPKTISACKTESDTLQKEKRDWQPPICSFCVELLRDLPSPLSRLETDIVWGVFSRKGANSQKGGEGTLGFPQLSTKSQRTLRWRRNKEGGGSLTRRTPHISLLLIPLIGSDRPA